MKRGKCPKCQSVEIARARPLDYDNGGGRTAVIARDNNPSALIFKDRRTTQLEALVCESCGYTELYADDPRALKP